MKKIFVNKMKLVLLLLVVSLLVPAARLNSEKQQPVKQPLTDTAQQQKKPPAKRPLEVEDMMKFKKINDASISEDGKWVAYNSQPGRGNGAVIIYNIATKTSTTIQRGKKPVFSKNSRWVAALIEPEAAKLVRKRKKGETPPKTGMALTDTVSGKTTLFNEVKEFQFADNSQWLVYKHFPVKNKNDAAEKKNAKKKNAKKKKLKKNKKNKKPERWDGKMFTLVLRHLPTGTETRFQRTLHYALDPSNLFLAYSTYGVGGLNSGLFARNLRKPTAPKKEIIAESYTVYTNLTWSKKHSRLAFIFHRDQIEKDKEQGDIEKARAAWTAGYRPPYWSGTGSQSLTYSFPVDPKARKKKRKRNNFSSGLLIWDGIKRKFYSAVPKEKIPPGWMIPAENKLKWTEDGERLYFGFKPINEYQATVKKEHKKMDDIFDVQQILQKMRVDVWHWNDPKIVPHQKKSWEKNRKKIYYGVYHYRKMQFLLLADLVMPDLEVPENPRVALGYSFRPYHKDLTWDGEYIDAYICDINSGFRRKIVTRLRTKDPLDLQLSPQGRFAVYYKDKHWYLYDVRLKFARRLTATIKTPFYNEDHDYPMPAPSYGSAGWTEKDRSIIIYDKYDIWEFFTNSKSNKFRCLTEGKGRQNKLSFRIKETDPEAKFFKPNETCLLTAYSNEEKYTAFYSLTISKKGAKKLVQEPKTFTFLKKAQKSNRMIYTRESFEEFPDIWVSDMVLGSREKISDVNPQKEEFLWGKSELIDWNTPEGTRLQGIVIKPENYDANKRYPVLVYFYRIFTKRLHLFNEVVINHRPCYPFYTGHDYVVFLPDVRFAIGKPGESSTRCIESGVQKLIDLGIADPKAIGLHGHSWSGYQAAFIITQSNMFAATIAGAPVANMTSAYSGIRWKTGKARQYQYEKSQSRLGKTLWEDRQMYIDNSPVFFADKINTPLLIQFGDRDGAVPWYQGIELYLAMRRLNKNCIFLQYNNEGHHLKKYPNKLDYTIKMKQYLDHYLKGKPAPKWMTKGVSFMDKIK
ncbi:MAG: S9 family peptidase [bacterium]|nr:S9 family peptidase [bacterium]